MLNQYSIPGNITPDGRYVTFRAIEDSLYHNGDYRVNVYIRDMSDSSSSAITRVSENDSHISSNGNNMPLGLTSDGRYSLFRSSATNLV
jgi:hypothetical protein